MRGLGYNENIKNKHGSYRSFRDYVLTCTGWGLDSTLLLGTKPESPEATPDHVKRNMRRVISDLRRHRAELRKAESMSPEEAEAKAGNEYGRLCDLHSQEVAKADELKKWYRSTLEGLEKLKPPTPDHAEFIEYMKLHVTDDMNCFYGPPAPQKQTGDVYRTRLINEGKSWVVSYKKDLNKIIEQERKRRKWVRALLESLPPS